MEKAHSNIEVIDKAVLQATDKLDAITTRINNENMVARTSLFNIAGALYEAVDICKKVGYKGIGDYAETVFGYSKSSTSKMVKVARYFLTLNEVDIEGSDGKAVFYTCELPCVDSAPWTMGQLQELLAVDTPTARVMIDKGILSSDMRAIDIRNAISNAKLALEKKNAENADSTAENAENADSTAENTENAENADSTAENAENAENADSTAENTENAKPENAQVNERPTLISVIGADKWTDLHAAYLDIQAVYESIKTVAKYKEDAARLEKVMNLIDSLFDE